MNETDMGVNRESLGPFESLVVKKNPFGRNVTTFFRPPGWVAA